MKWQARLAVPFALVLVGVFSSPLSAQPARISLTVTDADGNGVDGAVVTVTTAKRGNFKLEKTTNKRGKAMIMVPSAVFVYQFAVEADGYSPVTADVKPKLGETSFSTIALTAVTRSSGSSGATSTTTASEEDSGGDPGRTVFTPAETAFNEGVNALEAKDFATAKAKFLEAGSLDPKMVAVHSALATAYLDSGDFENALSSAQTFAKLAPDSPRGLRLLYEAHSGLGNANEAEKTLKRLADLGQDADTATLLYNEGADATREGDLASGEKRFLEALEVEPGFMPAVEALMLVYARQEKWSEAAPQAESFLAANPGNARALRVRYEAYRGLGDQVKSQAAFDALAEVDPAALAKTFSESGVTKFNAGDIAGAAIDLERVIELVPENASAHYHLGLAYSNSEESAKAKEHLEKFLALAPDDPNADAAREMLKYLE